MDLALGAGRYFKESAGIAANDLAFLLDQTDKGLERGGLRIPPPSQDQFRPVVIVLEAKEANSGRS
jgi:hypothetical protein